ncbi:MAG: hypothetical protein M3Y51_01330, partial [Actinomycetota bacterium]|nr:hypothetical protein [Actinomycetota bacterium]
MIALLRLGRREAWRHKARSTLVLLLILVPVGLSAAVLMLVPAVTADPAFALTQELGTAQARVTTTGGAVPPAEAPWDDPAVRGDGRAFEASSFTLWLPVGDDDLVTGIGAEQGPAADAAVGPERLLSAGRLPDAPGEVALDGAS